MNEAVIIEHLSRIEIRLASMEARLAGDGDDLLSLNQVEKQFKASRGEIREAIKRGRLAATPARVVQGGKRSSKVRRADAAELFAVRK